MLTLASLLPSTLFLVFTHILPPPYYFEFIRYIQPTTYPLSFLFLFVFSFSILLSFIDCTYINGSSTIHLTPNALLLTLITFIILPISTLFARILIYLKINSLVPSPFIPFIISSTHLTALGSPHFISLSISIFSFIEFFTSIALRLFFFFTI
jgi:hypothetical protein